MKINENLVFDKSAELSDLLELSEPPDLLESQLNLPTQKIKKARKDLGLTQAQMGAMLECDGETVKKMEYPLNRKTYRRPARRMMRLLDAYLAGYRPPDWPK